MSGETQRFWDQIYRQRSPSLQPQPHPYLVEQLSGKPPGTALEVGCGDGANAIWLAAQGWNITAVDISEVALRRAEASARKAGVASQVRWARADLRDWTTTETFDLTAAFYPHTPLELDYPSTLGRVAGQVRAGGTLVVIGHYTLPPWAWNPQATDGLLSAGELASALSLDRRNWRIGMAEERARAVTHSGRQHIVLDAVLHAERTASVPRRSPAVNRPAPHVLH